MQCYMFFKAIQNSEFFSYQLTLSHQEWQREATAWDLDFFNPKTKQN